MKKVLVGILITLLVICVIVEGVIIFKQKQSKNEGQGNEGQVVQTPTGNPQSNNDPVRDGENLKIEQEVFKPEEDEIVYTYKKVVVTDKLNNEDKYEYEIPQIVIDSDDVERINEEILTKYEGLIDDMYEEQAIDLSFESLKYKYYENNGIISLAIFSATESQQAFNCEVYNIDVESKEQISNSKFLEKIEKEETGIANQVLEIVSNLNIYQLETTDIEEEFINGQKEKTIEKYTDISIEDIPMYLNDEGHICVYVSIYAVAGGEMNSIVIDLEAFQIVEVL